MKCRLAAKSTAISTSVPSTAVYGDALASIGSASSPARTASATVRRLPTSPNASTGPAASAPSRAMFPPTGVATTKATIETSA